VFHSAATTTTTTTDTIKRKWWNNANNANNKRRGNACPTFFTQLLFPYAFCMVVRSIVLMVDGDDHGCSGGGDGGGFQLICPGLFSHLSVPVNIA